MKLLLVDTDRDLVEMLTSWLKTLGYEVLRAYTGEQAQLVWEQHQPDLVIVDTALQDVDALKLCHEMRHIHDALVLALSADQDMHQEVHCLEAGADDYLRKPFFPAQLLARLHALCRRGRSSLPQRPPSVLQVGPLSLDSLHQEVIIEGKTSRLTPTESKLLHLLMANADHVCTTDQIVAYLWGLGNESDGSLIKAHIRHLRQKIEPDPSNPRYVLTIPNVGYSLMRAPLEGEHSQDLLHALGVASRKRWE